MKKLWIVFIAIFVFSFAVLGWVGTEIFRQAPPIPREVVTTDGQVLIASEEIQNGQNVWQAMGGMSSVGFTPHSKDNEFEKLREASERRRTIVARKTSITNR